MDPARADLRDGPPEGQGGGLGEGTAVTPAAMLDLNPTGFVDDLTNMVGQLKCSR